MVRKQAHEERKEKRRLLILKCIEDLETFRLLSVTRRKVRFLYKGRRVIFERYYDQVARRGGDRIYVGDEKYAEMFVLADMFMRAAERGEQEQIAEWRKRQAERPKKERGPKTDPRQGRLFE